jgi:hypothetical protein
LAAALVKGQKGRVVMVERGKEEVGRKEGKRGDGGGRGRAGATRSKGGMEGGS